MSRPYFTKIEKEMINNIIYQCCVKLRGDGFLEDMCRINELPDNFNEGQTREKIRRYFYKIYQELQTYKKEKL